MGESDRIEEQDNAYGLGNSAGVGRMAEITAVRRSMISPSTRFRTAAELKEAAKRAGSITVVNKDGAHNEL